MKVIKYFCVLFFGLLALVIICNVKRDVPVEELKLKYAPAPSRFIQIQNMIVHYRIEGLDNDSLPIILLHGTGASLHTFDAWTKELKINKKVIRLDLPGFGLTGPFSNREYRMSAYIAFLDEFVNKLGVSKCILAGNSLGGNIAWHYVLAHPEKVQKLILIDAAGLQYKETKPPIAFKLARIPVLNKLLTIVTPRSIVQKSLEDVYANKSLVTDELVDRYLNLSIRAGNRQAMVDRLSTPLDYTTIPQLKELKTATLILWGENDMLIPVSTAHDFSKLLANDTIVIIKNCGHVPMEECPSESLKAVINFIGL